MRVITLAFLIGLLGCASKPTQPGEALISHLQNNSTGFIDRLISRIQTISIDDPWVQAKSVKFAIWPSSDSNQYDGLVAIIEKSCLYDGGDFKFQGNRPDLIIRPWERFPGVALCQFMDQNNYIVTFEFSANDRVIWLTLSSFDQVVEVPPNFMQDLYSDFSEKLLH